MKKTQIVRPEETFFKRGVISFLNKSGGINEKWELTVGINISLGELSFHEKILLIPTFKSPKISARLRRAFLKFTFKYPYLHLKKAPQARNFFASGGKIWWN